MDGRRREAPDGGVEVVVSDDARQRFYDSRGYGRPLDGGALALAPVEAAHLLFRDDLDSVDGEGFRRFLAAGDAGFAARFLVYKDLRDRGFYLSPARPGWVAEREVDGEPTRTAVYGVAAWRDVDAAGGVVGVLVGSLLELRAEHERTRTLNQRNRVFLRLFRHDIRTSLNLIRGHLDLVAGEKASPPESPAVIRDQLAHIERLSDAANRLDDLESMVLETWQEYAPNMTEENVITSHTMLPHQREAMNPNMYLGRGLIGHHDDSQILDNHVGYRTPVDGLYACSSACHPGGGISGGAGYIAAKVVHEDLDRDPWWDPVDVRESFRNPA